MGEEKDACQFLCSWGISPMIYVPPGHSLRLVNNSPSYMLQVPFKLLLLCCISLDCLLCCLLKCRDSVSLCPLALPSQVHRFLFSFSLQVLSPAHCKNSWNLASLVFKVKCYRDSSSPWGLPGVTIYFFPSPCLQYPSPSWTFLWVCLIPNGVSTFPNSSLWPLL